MSEETISILDRYRKTEESIATYYRYLVDREVFSETKTKNNYSRSQKISVETIIDKARHKKHEFPSIYMQFGTRLVAVLSI
jgi:hypothetical protein